MNTELARFEWEVFTLDYDEEKAKEYFAEKHGYKPKKIVRDHNYLWIGPVIQTVSEDT
jgi:hypothetical protein